MPVKRRAEKRRRELTADELDWLHDGTGGIEFKFFVHPDTMRALWVEFAEEIVAEHAKAHPGTRPARWWKYSAPEPRRRLGGTGTPSSERLADAPRLYLGVPQGWITDDDLDFWEHFSGRPLGVPAVDLDDPPMYESEAAYLARLKLLLPGERRRLEPAAFEPVSLVTLYPFLAGEPE